MAKGRGVFWLSVLAALIVTPFLFDFRDPLSFLRKGERLVNIDLAQLKKMQAANDIQLIDVREPAELEEAGRIPGATNIPLGDVEEAFLMDSKTFLETYNIKKPEKSDANLVFTCRSGVRSLRAVKIVEELGYK
ncbi:uncharacterized protein DEA37_0000842 [Paragonimus westermani]|uniref:Rhodanese domain-containing protein n=1 Tax=Paragonimus westermani TaxID=34504 RepID=A0A5J4NZ08_9TREM|nr:uncharacterized protein DEA37_0000842 [Paragonimus westermani]